MFKNNFSNYSLNPEENKLIDQSIICRGTILHHITLLESLLNAYIAFHFCGKNKEKIEEMVLMILGDERMTLNSKAQVFYALATTHDKQWYESYKSFRVHPDKKKTYSMNNDLVYSIEERNVFAHRVLDKGDLIDNLPLPKGILRFARLKNDYEALDYDEKKYHDLERTILNVCFHFYASIGGLIKDFT